MSFTTKFTENELEALTEKTTIPRFAFFPGGLLGLSALAWSWPNDAIGWTLFWTLFTAYNLFCWTSCFHETAHQTLCGSANFSIWLGRFLGTAMFTPYTVYRESHIRHHAYLNKPSDWELWPYCDPKTSLTFRRIFVWFDLLLGMFTSPIIYGRTYFHRDSPIKNPVLRRAIAWEYVGMVVVWGGILSAVAYSGAWMGLLKVWVIPHLIAGVFQNGRKFTEHLGMSSYDPLKGTRTVIADNAVSRLCTYLNFDIFVHGPHHRHPRVAHDRLIAKMQDYLAEQGPDSFPIYSTYLRATWDMLPNMWRKPGVGVNAGGELPELEKTPDVENFVADVTTEVIEYGNEPAVPA